MVPHLDLVPEVPRSGKDHGYTQSIGCVDHFLIAHRPPRLDHCRGPSRRHCLQTVREGEKGVGGSNTVGQWQQCFHGAKFRRIYPAHLARAHPDRLPIASVHNGVRLYVLSHPPGKKK